MKLNRNIVVFMLSLLLTSIVAHVLLLVLITPDTHAWSITREQYKMILDTSSVANGDGKLKAGALTLLNGYEGSQFLLKWSLAAC